MNISMNLTHLNPNQNYVMLLSAKTLIVHNLNMSYNSTVEEKYIQRQKRKSDLLVWSLLTNSASSLSQT